MRTTIVAAVLLFAGTGLCAAQPYGIQPPPRSAYPDGTGNMAVDALNAGQLDQNYRGPWHAMPAARARPRWRQSAPVHAGPAYAQPAYAQPVYGQPAYGVPAYPVPGGY